MSSISTAVAAATVLTDLDPTGVATNILNLVVAIHEQYEQMEANKEACQGLDKKVLLVSRVITDSMQQRKTQTDPCKKALLELQDCLIKCQELIQSILSRKNTNAFVVSGSDKENIEKLTNQLNEHLNILNVALGMQISNRIEEYVGSESDVRAIVEGIKGILQGVGIQIGDVGKDVDVLNKKFRELVDTLMAVRSQTTLPQPKTMTFSDTGIRNKVGGSQINIGQIQSQKLTSDVKEEQEFKNTQRITRMEASIKATDKAASIKAVAINYTDTENFVEGNQVHVNSNDPNLAALALKAAFAHNHSLSSSSVSTATADDLKAESRRPLNSKH